MTSDTDKPDQNEEIIDLEIDDDFDVTPSLAKEPVDEELTASSSDVEEEVSDESVLAPALEAIEIDDDDIDLDDDDSLTAFDDEYESDEGDDFVSVSSAPKAKGGKTKTWMIGGAVIVAGVALGGFLAQSGVLNGESVSSTPLYAQSQSAPSSEPFPVMDNDMVAAPSSEEEVLADIGDIPQPHANQNPVPRLPEEGAEILDAETAAGALAPEIPASSLDEPVEELPVSDEAKETLELDEEDSSAPLESAADSDDDVPALVSENELSEDDLLPVSDVTEMVAPVVDVAPPVLDDVPDDMFDVPSVATDAALDIPSSPLPEQVAGVSNKTVSMTAEKPEEVNVYYDSVNTTGSALSTATGPRKVDPRNEPASTWVTVHTAHESGDWESLLVSANRALKLERYDAAAEMFERLYTKNPRDMRVLMGRAVALQNTGRTASALDAYEGVLDVDPDNADAMVNMMGLLRQEYPSVALRRLLDMKDRFPDNAPLLAQIAVTQGDMGNMDEAIRYMGMALSLEPNNPQHYFNMAILADRAGDKENAVKYYEQALETDIVYGKGRSLPRDTIYNRLHALRR